MAAALDNLAIRLAESGRVPDAVVRAGIRRIVADRARHTREADFEARAAQKRSFLEGLAKGPIALATEHANAQHYELPPAFFEAVLGPRLKYSCALFEPGATSLADAEDRMLAATCERAAVGDGMEVLDLGCGWGSLSLWIAEHYPDARVVGVSNSKPQREFILRRAAARGLTNVEVETADVNHFEAERRFDRVVSVEMFEHVRNHAALLGRVADWLTPEGRLFVHHFCHREAAYPYETDGSRDWMGRYFFTGGIMPSEDLLLHHQRDLEVEAQWRVAGSHYQQTSNAWLERMDRRDDRVTRALAEAYGKGAVDPWRQRWRMFFMACAELFGWDGGEEWFVTHVRMAPRAGACT
jgi:cyclopropane-fatty-acyl-phospholipid synthase